MERPDLFVIINAEDRIVRVYENTPATAPAYKGWLTHDQAYCDNQIPEAEYKTVEEWMDDNGIKAYTTESRWDL